MSFFKTLLILSTAAFFAACAKPDSSEAQLERARLEARTQAQAEFDKQMEEKDKLLKRSRDEAKATAEEELNVQIANQAKIVEQARQQGRAQAQEQLNVENGNLTSRSTKMESDLAKRHRFYQALAGTYEGQLATEQGNYSIRITLVSSLPPYKSDRTRQLEEITQDINNLYLNAQIVQWSSENQLSSVGCRVTQIRPDMINGTISIASPECANIYLLSINSSSQVTAKPFAQSKTAASSVQKGKLKTIPSLTGEVRPTTNSAIYQLYANRKGTL